MSMSTKVVLPHNPEAEASVIGTCLCSRTAIGNAIKMLFPGDFYETQWRVAWLAITDLYEMGQDVDAITVAHRVQAENGPHARPKFPELTTALVQTPSLGAFLGYVDIVIRLKAQRDEIYVAAELTSAAQKGSDPYIAAETAIAALSAIRRSGGELSDFTTLDEILDADESTMPYVIQNCIREDEVLMLTGGEGAGKSTILRQIGVGISQGIDPFTFKPVEPLPVLMFDAENSRGVIRETGKWMRSQAKSNAFVDYDPQRLMIMRRTRAFNIRDHNDRGELENALQTHRPKLVIAGPMYKMAAKLPDERDDDLDAALIRIWDDLRGRYGFGLILETHTKKDRAAGNMEPFGSSLLLRWPDFGFGLRYRKTDGALVVVRWRGDRSQRNWPGEFIRDRAWPWKCRWPNGTANDGAPVVGPPEEEESQF